LLNGHRISAWLIVVESKGVNVWCAAGAGEFDTRAVVAAVKTSMVEEKVNHRKLILPPLAAPGVVLNEVKKKTAFRPIWGPVRMEDTPTFIENDYELHEPMRRVTYNLKERLDTALGSVFTFYLIAAIITYFLSPFLMIRYLIFGAITFLFFFSFCEYIPGNTGIKKVLVIETILGAALVAMLILKAQFADKASAPIIISMIMTFVYGGEMGGFTPHKPAELDAVLAKLGLKKFGNVFFADTLRGDLLTRKKEIALVRDKCVGCGQCHMVCPIGLWSMDRNKKAILNNPQDCACCTACIVQCPSAAISAKPVA
jgi:NAD-dependent dihydropyrimidine dehydrogenase PreA subunit